MEKKDLFIRTLVYHITKDEVSPKIVLERYRDVSRASTNEFEEELHVLVRRNLHKEFGYTPLIGHPALTAEQINEVCGRLHGIKEESHLEDLVVDQKTRREILALVYDFFRDIPDYYSIENLAQSDSNERNSQVRIFKAFDFSETAEDEEELDLSEFF